MMSGRLRPAPSPLLPVSRRPGVSGILYTELSAGDFDADAVDIGGPVRGQKHDGVGQVLGTPSRSMGMLSRCPVAAAQSSIRVMGVSMTPGDIGEHPDVIPGVFPGQRAGEAHTPALPRRRGRSRRREQGLEGACVEDNAALPPFRISLAAYLDPRKTPVRLVSMTSRQNARLT